MLARLQAIRIEREGERERAQLACCLGVNTAYTVQRGFHRVAKIFFGAFSILIKCLGFLKCRLVRR